MKMDHSIGIKGALVKGAEEESRRAFGNNLQFSLQT